MRHIADDDSYVIKMTVRVVDQVHQALKAAARARRMSVNELVNRLIHDYIVAHDREQVRRWHEEQGAAHEERIAQIRRRLGR